MNDAPLTQTRFQALLEAYGARPERWPESERNAAIELLNSSESARVLAQEQHEIDAWLSVPSTPKISAKLILRLNAIPEKQGIATRPFLCRWRGWVKNWTARPAYRRFLIWRIVDFQMEAR